MFLPLHFTSCMSNKAKVWKGRKLNKIIISDLPQKVTYQSDNMVECKIFRVAEADSCNQLCGLNKVKLSQFHSHPMT